MRLVVIFLILLFSSPAYANTIGEPIPLSTGIIIYGYSLLDLPSSLRKSPCDTYVFKDNHFAPVKNGLYTSEDNKEFLVEDNCLYPLTGTSFLKNGKAVQFFAEDKVNTNGNLAFFCSGNKCIKVPDGTYILSNGQEFEIIDGHADGSFFDGNRLQFEERN